jgi:hypothetical protein
VASDLDDNDDDDDSSIIPAEANCLAPNARHACGTLRSSAGARPATADSDNDDDTGILGGE